VVITNPDGVTATLSNGFTYQGPLTVTSVNPASVVKSGGVTITITGTDFTGTPTVTIGGVEATDVNRIDATTITAVTPALAAGTYHVVVTNPDTQSATLTNGITYVEPAPTVTSVNPSSGAVSGGTNVTVTGTNFMPLYDNYTKLLIHADGTNGSTTIADSEVTPKSLTANGNAAISTVKSKFGGSSVFFDGNGDYLSSPASTDWNLGGDWTIDLWLFPTSFHTSNMFPETYFNTLFSYIPASGWLQVFLNGTGQVKISSQAQGEQTWTNQTVPMYQWTHLAIVSSSTSVTVYINGVSQGSKTITTPSSSGAIQIGWDGNPEREFTGYMDEFRISKGIARWTSDFTPPTVACNPVTGPGVTFGGSSATNVVFVNSTTLTATTPAHTVGQVDLVVTNPDSQTGTLTNGFTYRDAPTITSAAPASVPNTGGTTVTINGTGFYGTPTVSIGSTTASVTAATATTLTITTPAYSAGAVDVVVANPDGQIATLTGGLTYTAPAPTVTSISPVSGPVAGGTNVTITGSDFIVSEAGTGGTITNSGLYTVHTFTSSGTFTLPTARNVEVLVVAGGGGGGKAEAVGDAAGGGGAGGVIHVTSYSASAGSLSVTVGNGGNGSTQTAITGENGGNSIFGTLIAIGGGGGGSDGSYQGVDGGSGGGAANCYESELYGFGVPSSSGTVGQGNAGGAANFEPRLLRDGSGGGGAGGPGEERANRVGGAGGIGLPFSIYNGTPIYYAGGGGGGAGNSLGGAGIHGGGNGGRFSGTGTTENGLSGTPNTGGGGGGGAVDNGNGGNGGSGIVIVRYLHTSPIVTFGGINATNVTVTSSTTLTATTPAHAAGVTDVAVTNSGGQTSTLPSSYTYINPPSINSVTPSSVLNTGGTSVTIAGTDFFGTPAVTFDGTAGTVTAVTSTSLTVTTPAHPTGIVDVVVTNPDGQYATLPNGLTYTTPASPLPESGGIITSNGGAPVTVRGICWSTSPNPTIADNKTTNGEGSGTFLTSIPGLAIATTYHVRAYATNRVGTAYGNDEVFTTHAAVPVVTTTAATSVTQNSATSGGIIVSEEGAAILAKGVCWSTSANPTTSGNTTSNGSGSSGYSSSITGLISGTTYYVRAYATNSMGTAYGNQVSFTTP
jgi:hypothetical protein